MGLGQEAYSFSCGFLVCLLVFFSCCVSLKRWFFTLPRALQGWDKKSALSICAELNSHTRSFWEMLGIGLAQWAARGLAKHAANSVQGAAESWGLLPAGCRHGGLGVG